MVIIDRLEDLSEVLQGRPSRAWKLRLAGLTAEENRLFERHIKKYNGACGCPHGTVAMLLALTGYLALLYHGGLHRPEWIVAECVGGFVVVLLSMGLGKMSGILSARRSLRSLLERLRHRVNDGSMDLLSHSATKTMSKLWGITVISVTSMLGCGVQTTPIAPPPIVVRPGAPDDPTLEGDYDPIRIVGHSRDRTYRFVIRVEPESGFVLPDSIAVKAIINESEVNMERLSDGSWQHLYTLTDCDEYLRYKYEITYRYYSWFETQTATVKWPSTQFRYFEYGPQVDYLLARINRQPQVSMEPTELRFYCDASNTAPCNQRTVTIVNRSRTEIRVAGQIRPGVASVGDSSGTAFAFVNGTNAGKGLATPPPLPFGCDEVRTFDVSFNLSRTESRGTAHVEWSRPAFTTWTPLPDIPLSGKVFLF